MQRKAATTGGRWFGSDPATDNDCGQPGNPGIPGIPDQLDNPAVSDQSSNLAISD